MYFADLQVKCYKIFARLLTFIASFITQHDVTQKTVSDKIKITQRGWQLVRSASPKSYWSLLFLRIALFAYGCSPDRGSVVDVK